ncbi:hypothetical protein, partial [Micromonospora sp. WMMD736]|uniref:hypothetical protein n=1 Tax=Micromonospora sp. WMMD736 TaxID=3404112 RepID=UPI003B9240B9
SVVVKTRVGDVMLSCLNPTRSQSAVSMHAAKSAARRLRRTTVTIGPVVSSPGGSHRRYGSAPIKNDCHYQ